MKNPSLWILFNSNTVIGGELITHKSIKFHLNTGKKYIDFQFFLSKSSRKRACLERIHGLKFIGILPIWRLNLVFFWFDFFFHLSGSHFYNATIIASGLVQATISSLWRFTINYHSFKTTVLVRSFWIHDEQTMYRTALKTEHIVEGLWRLEWRYPLEQSETNHG